MEGSFLLTLKHVTAPCVSKQVTRILLPRGRSEGAGMNPVE